MKVTFSVHSTSSDLIYALSITVPFTARLALNPSAEAVPLFTMVALIVLFLPSNMHRDRNISVI